MNRYALSPTPNAVAGAPRGSVSASVVGSSSIFEATKEASEIARRSGRAVAFEFMRADPVVVLPESDPDLVARAWWFEFYGKTTEESWRDR